VMSFHLMPYADLDLSVKDSYRTVWVVLPNRYYDPKKGHALYNRYLDELELCAELGFDGVSTTTRKRATPSTIAISTSSSSAPSSGSTACA